MFSAFNLSYIQRILYLSYLTWCLFYNLANFNSIIMILQYHQVRYRSRLKQSKNIGETLASMAGVHSGLES
jgi:hypothetical protein